MTELYTVTLTEWEMNEILGHSAGVALTYASHKLFKHEEETLERWRALSSKLRRAKYGEDENHEGD